MQIETLRNNRRAEAGFMGLEGQGTLLFYLVMLAGAALILYMMFSGGKLAEMQQSLAAMRMNTQQMFTSSLDYTGLTNDLAIKSGLVPQKLIKGGTLNNGWGGGGGGFPMNPSTGKRYRGGNLLHLMAQERDDPRWMTYVQASKEGAQVRKDEHGVQVIYWRYEEEQQKKNKDGSLVLDERGNPVKEVVRLERPKQFTSVVFNAEQIDGLPPLEISNERTWNPVERAEGILRDSGATIEHKAQGRAYYSPSHDKIVLPQQAQFPDAGGYYDTALHELGHWTGHGARLNRDFSGPFGSQSYAREELRAEIASMMLAGEIDLPHNTESHAAYVQNWIQVLREEPQEVFRAAADAEQIMEFVMGLELKLEQMQTVEQAQQTEQIQQTEQAKTLKAEQPSQPQSQRHYLFVQFAEKEAVKELGGKWDGQARQWYAPAGADLSQFSKWQEPPAARQEQLAPKQLAPKQPRQYLAVPYPERGSAKASGAMWDSVAKSWYAGPDADMAKLEKWLPERQEAQSSATRLQEGSMPPREEFAGVLRSMGCQVDGEHPIMDGQRHRLAVEGDKQGEASGFYVGYLDGKPNGYAKNNRTGEEQRWKSQGDALTNGQQEQHKQEYAARKESRAIELVATHEKTAQRVLYQLSALHPATEPGIAPTSYMVTKGVTPRLGAFAGENGSTCLPAQDANGKLWTMQYIQEDGTKRFAKDGRKDGCFHAVGGTDALRNAPVLVIAEGYATASSLADALGMATVAAFDAGNVVSVAKALREKYPDKPMVIAGDDDRHQPANPGRAKAEQAAREARAQVVFPVFAPGEEGKGFTDFNDLATKSKLGLEAVKRQVAPILDKAVKLRKAELAQSKEQQRGHSR